MMRLLGKSIVLLLFIVAICCVGYPAVLWGVAHAVFPFQAEGSMVKGPDGEVVGSLLIGQQFTKDEYFWPRPSAAGSGYDAGVSSSSALAASNYALRDRVARAIGPIATYCNGPKAGQLVAPDVEAWFRQDRFQGAAGIVAQWAALHNGLAQGWVTADPGHAQYVNGWAKANPAAVAQFIKDNPATPQPQATDLAVVFFAAFSKDNPGKFPAALPPPAPSTAPATQTAATTLPASEPASAASVPTSAPAVAIGPVGEGSDIQSIFFDMWRQDHPDVELVEVPADMVTTSGSGLDPHITLANAEFQLPRVAGKWAANTKRDEAQVRAEIKQILQDRAIAAWDGLAGEKIVNVLEVNLELRKRYGQTH